MFISSTLNIPLYMQGCSFTDRVTVQQSHLSVWREMTVSTWTVLVCMDRTTSVKMDSVFVLTMEWIVSSNIEIKQSQPYYHHNVGVHKGILTLLAQRQR